MYNKTDISVLARGGAERAVIGIPPPKSRWRTRILLPAALLFAFSTLLLYAARDALLPAREVWVVPVILKSGMAASGSVAFQAAGWIEADPYSSYISALSDGIVKEMLVLEGDKVEAGQVVARMVDDDAKLALARAEADVLQRKADVTAAGAALKAAQQQWDNPIERVRAVSVAESMLAETKAEHLRNDGELAMQKARADELKDQLQREDSLAEARAVPEGQRIQTRLRLKTQEALIVSSESAVTASAAKVQQQEAEVLAAKENLRLRIADAKELESSKAQLQLTSATLAMAEATLGEARLRLQRMEVRSPSSGVVMERLTEPGSRLMQNGNEMHAIHVLKIYNPERLQVRVDVPLANAAQVSVGQETTITAEVLRDTVFHGKIIRILHQADIQKNTLQVKVSVDKPVPALKPEMLARVQFLAASAPAGGSSKDAERLFIPESALQHISGMVHVWIVDKGRQTADSRMVTVGTSRLGDNIEISDGLSVGDWIIVGDTASLREGQRIRVMGESEAKPGRNRPWRSLNAAN